MAWLGLTWLGWLGFCFRGTLVKQYAPFERTAPESPPRLGFLFLCGETDYLYTEVLIWRFLCRQLK